MIYFVLLVLIAISLSSCKYSKEEILYPVTTCDTTNIKFSGRVASVFALNCLMCHGNNVVPPSGGIRLQDYADVKIYIDRSLGAMSHLPGFKPMPLGSTETIDACQIKVVRIWKDAGAPNN